MDNSRHHYWYKLYKFHVRSRPSGPSAPHHEPQLRQDLAPLTTLTPRLCHTEDMARHIENLAALKALVGEHIGYSDYLEIDQARVQLFADATGDQQWIHTDPERAKAQSPFGGPIAHGYLTLSLGPVLLPQVFSVGGIAMGVNYGANKVRFMSPVPVGSKLRAGVKVLAVDDINGGAQVTLETTFEVEGAPKPSCIAEVIFRYYSA